MDSALFDLIKDCAKDEHSEALLKKAVQDVVSQYKTVKKQLSLLEASIRNDYDSILITELDYESPGPKIVYVNEGFTRITGYTKEEVIGKTPRILQGPKTDRATLDRLKKCLDEGKSFFGQAVNYRKDGSEFINQWDIHPLYNEDGQITHWVSYQHDITKRKRAEISFNELETDFDNLMEYSKRTLLDISKEGKIIQVNRSFRDLTGFEKDELLQHDITALFPETDKSQSKTKLLQSLGAGAKELDLVIQSKDGIAIETKVTPRPMKIKDEDAVRLVVENISMQKKVLKALQSRNFNLSELITNKTELTYALRFNDAGVATFEWLSEQFETFTGFKPIDFIKKKGIDALVSGKQAATLKEHHDVVLSGKSHVEELEFTKADGTTVHVLDYANPEFDPVKMKINRITGSILLRS